jgi:hypothetical protein
LIASRRFIVLSFFSRGLTSAIAISGIEKLCEDGRVASSRYLPGPAEGENAMGSMSAFFALFSSVSPRFLPAFFKTVYFPSS